MLNTETKFSARFKGIYHFWMWVTAGWLLYLFFRYVFTFNSYSVNIIYIYISLVLFIGSFIWLLIYLIYHFHTPQSKKLSKFIISAPFFLLIVWLFICYMTIRHIHHL